MFLIEYRHGRTAPEASCHPGVTGWNGGRKRPLETRRRLVDATFALHVEQGISATTMTDIAARAGVSVGTVYHHFPTYPDAVAACARHVDESQPLPAADIFAGVTSMHARVRRLAQEIFRFYQRLPGYERVRSERFGMPPIEAYAARARRTTAWR